MLTIVESMTSLHLSFMRFAVGSFTLQQSSLQENDIYMYLKLVNIRLFLFFQMLKDKFAKYKNMSLELIINYYN